MYFHIRPGIPTNILNPLLPSFISTTRPAQPNLLYFITLTVLMSGTNCGVLLTDLPPPNSRPPPKISNRL